MSGFVDRFPIVMLDRDDFLRNCW